MENKKIRTLLSASLLSMLGVAALVGGTYALFSDSAKVTNHLQAGNLNISLLRTKLTKTTIDNETGYMKTVTNEDTVDFSNATSSNIFGIEENEFVVPTSSFVADLKLVNGGVNDDFTYKAASTVAFKYSVSLSYSDLSDDELISQLKVTVTHGTTEVASKMLNEFDGSTLFSGTMTKADRDTTFSVKLEFVNDTPEVNNPAQDKQADFDLLVSALQLTEAE